MSRQKFTPRADHRRLESQRISESVSLAQRYPDLKSLTVEFAHFSPEGTTRSSQIKYTVNPAFAKAVFCLDCLNADCIRGDFDLSDALAKAVTVHQETVSGEMTCQGWSSKSTIDQVRCGNVLRYKLTLEY